jgi:hypothetical protein
VLGQLLGDVVVVSQLFHLAHTVHQDHFLELFIGLGVADHAHERRQARAGGQHVQALGWQQVVDQQGAGGLLADDDGVTHLDVLQARGQRAVGHLDGQELQVLFVVGADDAVGAQQRLVVHLQADHGEVPVGKAQRRVAGGGEAEKPVGPVVNGQHAFFEKCTHGGCLRG